LPPDKEYDAVRLWGSACGYTGVDKMDLETSTAFSLHTLLGQVAPDYDESISATCLKALKLNP
jgi:hypothetical protein